MESLRAKLRGTALLLPSKSIANAPPVAKGPKSEPEKSGGQDKVEASPARDENGNEASDKAQLTRRRRRRLSQPTKVVDRSASAFAAFNSKNR